MASGIIDLGSSGKMSGRITWSSSSNGPQNNNSNVTATLQVRRNDGYGPTTGTFTGSLFIHDEQQDYSVHARVSSDWITLKSFSKTVGHSGDGKGSCHIWGNISGPSGTSMSGSYVEADTWVTLDTIPRYASFIEHWIGATGLNSVTVHWATDVPCDRVQYSLNGGGWADTASTNYTVGGLTPSTTYTIKSRTRRTDSQLWNESGTLTFTTRSISAVQSWTQLTLPAPGTNNTTIRYKISNDSGNATYVYLERNNAGDNYGCNSGSTSVTSGDRTLTLSSTALNQIYNEHASVTASYNGDINKRATSGMQLTARTSGLTNYYNSYGVTFIMTKANCGPTAIKDFTCQEQQADVAALTGCPISKTYTNGNGLIILKGYSNVKINVTANPLSVRAGASNRAISINGSEWLTSTSATSKTLAKVTTDKFSITAKDSRDFSLSKSSTGVTLKTYTPVNISSMRIDRGDGVSTTAYLTLAGTYNALNFGAVTNSVTSVKLQIKTKNTPWTATKITGATTGVIDATKVNEYTITNLLTASSGNIACSAKELKVSGTSGNSLQFVLGTEYDARIIVYDQLTSKSSFSSQVVRKDTSITSGKVLFSAIKNGGVCFGGLYGPAVGGALQVNSDSFFAFGDNSNSSIATPTNGNGIVLGADGANKTSANMRLFSWYGISFTTSCENQTIPVGQSAVYINCRTGDLSARGNITTEKDITAQGKINGISVNSHLVTCVGAKWFYIGDIEFADQGAYAVFDCYTGNGQNGRADQNVHMKILLKQGWTGGDLPIGITTQFTQNYEPGYKIKIKHLSRSKCQLFLYFPFAYNDLTYIINGSYSGFHASHTFLSSEPSTDKESVYYRNEGSVTLYNNSSGTTGTVTLSESAGNFNYLEIYYVNNHGDLNRCIKVSDPSSKNISIESIEPDKSDTGTYLRTAFYNISGNTIAYKYATYTALFNNGAVQVTRKQYSKIVKVLGYR